MMDNELFKQTQIAREQWAMKHYKKHETELGLNELKELDLEYPGWGLATGLPGLLFEVSMGGTRVRSAGNKKEFKIYYPDRGYPYLMSNGKFQSVHQLVARAFVDNPDPEHKTDVNHIDGNKRNNCYHNLEWCTRSYNIREAVRMGLNTHKKGEDAWNSKYINDQIREVCELLVAHPDWTYEKISRICKVRKNVVGDIYAGRSWQYISSEYIFPERNSTPTGENHWNTPYTDNQIQHVCQLLQDQPDLTYEQIEKETGVSLNTIGSIYRKEAWTQISKDYKFSKRVYMLKGEMNGNAKFTSEQAEQVCQLLDQVKAGKLKLTYKDIAGATGMSRDIVSNIALGKTWVNVAKSHPFYKAKFGDQAKQGPANNS